MPPVFWGTKRRQPVSLAAASHHLRIALRWLCPQRMRGVAPTGRGSRRVGGAGVGGAREATEESEGSEGLQRPLFQPPDPRSEPTAPPSHGAKLQAGAPLSQAWSQMQPLEAARDFPLARFAGGYCSAPHPRHFPEFFGRPNGLRPFMYLRHQSTNWAKDLSRSFEGRSREDSGPAEFQRGESGPPQQRRGCREHSLTSSQELAYGFVGAGSPGWSRASGRCRRLKMRYTPP